MSLEIVDSDPVLEWAYLFHHPHYQRETIRFAQYGVIDGVPYAFGAICEQLGRKWVFFQIDDEAKPYGKKILLACARMIKKTGGPLYALCDEVKYPQAPKLLKSMGFEETDEVIYDRKVWLWNS